MVSSLERLQRHIPAEELVDYFRMELPEERRAEVEDHIVGCTDCVDLASRVRQWGSAIEQWVETAHRDARQRDLVVGWSKQLDRLVQGAVLVVVGAAERATRIVTDFVDPLLSPVGALRFVPVMSGARGPDSSVVDAATTADNGMNLEVSISGEHEITVLLRELPIGLTAPRVTLFVDEEGTLQELESRTLARDPGGADYYLTKFEVTDGEKTYLFTIQQEQV